MKTTMKTEMLTREMILSMLSDEENARVSTSEGGESLRPGDEYIDLRRIEDGVHRATGSVLAMAGLLPKKAVEDTTWERVVARVSRGLVEAAVR